MAIWGKNATKALGNLSPGPACRVCRKLTGIHHHLLHHVSTARGVGAQALGTQQGHTPSPCLCSLTYLRRRPQDLGFGAAGF